MTGNAAPAAAQREDTDEFLEVLEFFAEAPADVARRTLRLCTRIVEGRTPEAVAADPQGRPEAQSGRRRRP